MRSDCINCKEFQIGLYDLAAANLEQFWETVVSRSKFGGDFRKALAAPHIFSDLDDPEKQTLSETLSNS